LEASKFKKMMWRSIRILRRFTVPQLLMTIPEGGSEKSVKTFLRVLVKHGVVKAQAAPEQRLYVLLNDFGPEVPSFG
jgi:hypothetical protein